MSSWNRSGVRNEMWYLETSAGNERSTLRRKERGNPCAGLEIAVLAVLVLPAVLAVLAVLVLLAVLTVRAVRAVRTVRTVHVSQSSRKTNVENERKKCENQLLTPVAPIERTLHPKDGTNFPVSISQEGNVASRKKSTP